MVFITRFILIVIATYAGTSLLAPLRILGWDIDIGLIALVLVGSYSSRRGTILWGAFSGFLLDCLNPQWMGAGVVSRSTAAFFLAIMREKLNIEHTFLDGVVIFVAGIIDRAIYLGLTQYREQFLYGLGRYIIPSSFYTAVFAMVLIYIYRLRKIFSPRIA